MAGTTFSCAMRNDKQINRLIALIIFINIYPVFIFSHYIPLPATFVQITYYVLMLVVIVLFGLPGKIEVHLLFVVFSALLSLIFNDVADKYNAPVRLGLFTIQVLSVGPLLYNATLMRFRILLFEKLMHVFMWIGGLSFFCLFGLPSFNMGHFSGLLAHSMLLGPVASLAGLYAFSKFINTEKRKKILFLALFGLNTVCVILASSRIAAIAYVFALIIYLLFSHFPWRKTAIIILVVFTVFLVISSDNQTQIQSDSETVFSRSMMENTRESLWNDRVAEFNSNPLIGVGFAVQNDAINEQVAENDQGRIEPGSTYLMILSMTGVVGGLAFLLFLIKPLINKKFWKQVIYAQPDKFAAVVFFMVHFIAEGYIFSAGSLLAFTFWLLMGSIYPYKGIVNVNN